MTEVDAIRAGYDRKGIGCSCRWGSKSHGDRCPEHGTPGERTETLEELFERANGKKLAEAV